VTSGPEFPALCSISCTAKSGLAQPVAINLPFRLFMQQRMTCKPGEAMEVPLRARIGCRYLQYLPTAQPIECQLSLEQGHGAGKHPIMQFGVRSNGARNLVSHCSSPRKGCKIPSIKQLWPATRAQGYSSNPPTQ